MNYTRINQNKWDEWSENGCIWATPISHDDFVKASKQEYAIYLTPLRPVPLSWINPVKNSRILALAGGGGQQCPYFVANGANVTVLDISEKQLNAERVVANREHYSITLVQGDMTHLFPFEDDSFDMIFNPISTSYIHNLEEVWSECNRVLKPNGKLMTGFANPTIYLFDINNDDLVLKYTMPFDPYVQLTYAQQDELFKSDGVQFGHSFEKQLGSIIKAGFSIIDFYEDYHPVNNAITKYDTKIGNIAAKLAHFMPEYFAVLAKKK